MRALLVSVLCLSMVCVSFGCQSWGKNKGPQMTERERANRSKLHATPPSVQDTFLREYPDATITSIDSYRDSAGRTLYDVKYVRSGKTGSAVYTPQGERAATADMR